MLSNGFILFHRHWLRHPAMKDSARRRFLWVHILCSAYFEDSKDGQIKAGQFIATRKQLADACGLSMSALKCAIADFVDAEILTVTSAGRGFPSVWTVTDYTLTQANLGRWSANHPTDHLTDHLTDHQTNHPTDHLGSSGNAENQRAGQGFEKGDGPPHRPPHGLSHGPPHEQSADHHNKQERIKNSESKNQNTPCADGGSGSEDFALEGQSSTPEKPTRGVVVNGERWLETLPRDEKNRPVYPSTFSEIWNIWINAQKRPGSRAKAADKAQTYRLVRDHLKDGTPYDDIVRGTERYLAINWNQIGCVQPPRFCRRKDPMFLDHLDAPGPETNGVAYSRDDFPNLALLGGYLAIVMRAHNVEGAPGRPVPPDDAWRVFQEQPPEIQAQVKAGVMG
jgi:hypothetical protein